MDVRVLIDAYGPWEVSRKITAENLNPAITKVLTTPGSNASDK